MHEIHKNIKKTLTVSVVLFVSQISFPLFLTSLMYLSQYLSLLLTFLLLLLLISLLALLDDAYVQIV
jgi:hypothetical protein